MLVSGAGPKRSGQIQRGILRMEKKLVALFKVALCVLAFGLIAQAQAPINVAGIWIITIQGPKGAEISSLNLDQDGAHLKGSMKPENGDEVQIENGVVNGKSVTFSVTLQEQNGKVKVEYKGTISGDTNDSMEGTFQQGKNMVKWTAKHQVYDGG